MAASNGQKPPIGQAGPEDKLRVPRTAGPPTTKASRGPGLGLPLLPTHLSAPRQSLVT